MSKQQSWPRWLLLLPLICAVGLAASLAAGPDLRLVEAVKNKDHDAIRSLLKQHMDVNATQADGATALEWAAHWDDLETANALIQAGAKVNAANDYGYTPLTLACDNANGAMVEALLKAGANANSALPATGETALMTCARTGSVEAVKALLAAGVNVNAKDNRRGQTALMRAAAEKHADVAQVLIEHGADIHARSNADFTPLMFAAAAGDLETVRTLLQAGADVNETMPVPDPLHACRAELERCVYVLKPGKAASAPVPSEADNGDAPDGGGYGAVPCKPQNSGAPDQGSAASRNSKTPKAAASPQADSMALGAPASDGLASGNAPSATKPPKSGEAPAADLVVTQTRDGRGTPDWENLGAMTPLLLAAASGHEALAIYLIEKGANPNAADTFGVTALHWTVAKGMISINGSYHVSHLSYLYRPDMLELLKALLAHGANPNVRIAKSIPLGGRVGGNIVGGTPFFFAAAGADTEAMRLLVAGGADPLLPNKGGMTPLMVAAGLGRTTDRPEAEGAGDPMEAVKLALQMGNDVNAVAQNGDTALHGAASRGENDMVQFLADKGAKVDVKDKRRETPWSLAVALNSRDVNHVDTGNLLVKLGAKPLTAADFAPLPCPVKVADEVKPNGSQEATKPAQAMQGAAN